MMVKSSLTLYLRLGRVLSGQKIDPTRPFGDR